MDEQTRLAFSWMDKRIDAINEKIEALKWALDQLAVIPPHFKKEPLNEENCNHRDGISMPFCPKCMRMDGAFTES